MLILVAAGASPGPLFKRKLGFKDEVALLRALEKETAAPVSLIREILRLPTSFLDLPTFEKCE